MYRYLKAKEVLSEEKLLTAYEVAVEYGILDYKFPNASLVAKVIEDYKSLNNINSSYYFSCTEHGFKEVYTKDLISNAMDWFIKKTRLLNSGFYSYNNIDFYYKNNNVTDFNNYKNHKKKKETENNDKSMS